MNIDYYNNFYISKSDIEGVGVFTKRKINKNTTIGIVMKNKISTNFFFIPDITSDLGRFINHSYTPNCYLSYDNKNYQYFIKSSKKIPINTELTLNYNINKPVLIEGSRDYYK